MNPLLKRLASLRMRVRLLDGWQGMCAVIALVLGVGVTVGILDYWVHLPSLARALTLISLLVGASAVVYSYLIKPFSNPCDDLTLALRVEEKYPELNDALASTVQFLKQGKDEQARVGGSASMRDRTIQDTLDKADACDFGSILDRRAAVLFGTAAFIVVVIAGVVIGMNRQYAAIAALRLLEPFGQHTWTRIAVERSAPGGLADHGDNKSWKDIEPGKKDRIAINRPYFIKVSLDGQIPAQARVEIQGHQIRSEKTVPLQVNAKDKTASFITSIDMTQQHQKFKFRILANDGTFPPRSNSWHEVEVLPPPKLTKDSPRITLYPPKYSDLPSPQVLPAGTGHLDIYEGTNVVLHASADRPLTEAWIEYRPENGLLTPAAMLSFFGEANPLRIVGQYYAGQAVWGRIPAKFEPAAGAVDQQTTFNINFTPAVSGEYVLHLRDEDQLERHEKFTLNVKKDPLPDVKLIRPSSTVTARPDMIVPFKFRITDETFAVRSVYVEYQRKLADGTLVGERERIMLYEAKAQGAMIPLWLGQLGLVPRTTAEPRLRKKQLDFETAWNLNNRFKEGEIVVVEVCAEDFCDIHLAREPGRSHAIELRIVSTKEIQRNVAQQLNEIRKKVEELAQLQKKALDAVNDTKQLDKLDQKALDRLLDAELIQRDVQNKVGKTPEQGLRRDLGDLMKQLKDNKLDKTDVAKQAGQIEGALDQIGQNELPQIEPRLVEARNELAQDNKNTPKAKKNLEETAELQKKVLEGLGELNEKLAPFAKMQDLRDGLRDLQQKQENLVKDIEQRKADKDDLIRDNPKNKEKIEKDFAADMKAKAKDQQEIAQQMQKLVEQFKAAQKERLKEGNKEDAKKLQDAIEKAEPRLQEEKKPKDDPKKQPENKDPIAAQMKQVADDLKNNTGPQKAIDKANNVLDNLDKMAAALEGRDQDTTKQEMQDLQQQQQKMDALAKKLQELQNETKKAQQLEDKAERKKEEERLAQKAEELQKEIEKQARELARMQEKRAAAALNDAAKDLAKAKQQLDKGEDAQPQQQEAKDKIDQARRELEEAQDQLARELLIKIHDQLKSVSEQQHAVLDRSERFQAKMLKRMSWTNEFLDTIEGNIDTQKGIGAESDGLKDKIKEAKVFSSILEQAKISMDKAATVMKERMDEGKDLRKADPDEKLTKDELKDEADRHDATVRHQKQAAQRLDRLLDALKEELDKKKKPQVAQKNDDPDMNPEDEPKDQPRMRNVDGIPSIAQLKVLKAEQEDLLARTAEFAKRNPELKELTDAQRMELNELHMEQDRLRGLFRDVTTPPQKEGDLP